MHQAEETVLAKVPEVTLIFWIIKVAATTLGETAGDMVTMSMNLGYLIGTALFAAIFVLAVWAQIRSKVFHPYVYWLTIVATTTVGTTLADYVDRSLGIGYPGGVTILLCLLLFSLWLWHHRLGSVSFESVATPQAECYYWVTILFSQTLGTALGDWTADSMGMGYKGAAGIFGVALLVIAAAYFLTRINRTLLFWSAFILTRPLGAVVGDFLDKPRNAGGLAWSRYTASAVLLAFIVVMVVAFRQRAASRAH